MPPPIFVLCIPGVAFFFLLQMLLCQAYHFDVTISRQKRYAIPFDPRITSETDSRDEMRPSRCKKPSDQNETRNSTITDDSADSGGENDGIVETEDEDTSQERNVQEDRYRSRRKSVFAESYDPSKDDEEIKVVHPKTEEEKQYLVDNLGKITLFQHLAKDQIVTVVDAMQKQPVVEGEYIMKQGDKGNNFYVIQCGVYDVYVKDEKGHEKVMHTYNENGSFGELALLYNQPRAATIVARKAGVLWTVDGQTFRRIVYKITYQKRLMYENLINNVPILKSLEPFERANLVDALSPMTFEHDDQIIKQGEEGDGMYFIISGGVKIIMMTSEHKEVFVKEYNHGDYFGELALITKKKRAASAFAVGKTHVAFLDRDAFERLLGPCMDVMRRNIDEYNKLLTNIIRDDAN